MGWCRYAGGRGRGEETTDQFRRGSAALPFAGTQPGVCLAAFLLRSCHLHPHSVCGVCLRAHVRRVAVVAHLLLEHALAPLCFSASFVSFFSFIFHGFHSLFAHCCLQLCHGRGPT